MRIPGAFEGLTHGQSEKLAQAIEGRGDLDEVHALIERRFRSVSCRKTFNALIGTPLARLHEREQWLEFATTLLESLSVMTQKV